MVMRSGRAGETVRGERALRPPHKDALKLESGIWPRNARCALCLTFDFDADSPYGDKPETGVTVRSRGVYGARVGIYRVLELLQQYDLPATFFVPGYTAEIYRDATRAIVRAGHELAHHGYRIGPGTLYPLLHGLERAGLLKSASRQAGGHARRLYNITPAGRRALGKAREKVDELYHELHEKHPRKVGS